MQKVAQFRIQFLQHAGPQARPVGELPASSDPSTPAGSPAALIDLQPEATHDG